mmetsp:Transcript_32086/g.73326  ORF Transcript_32086/g.73326 Transcript_32086/m.73326 type:complete len:482 (+) Transcript_32086:60-1505(+)
MMGSTTEVAAGKGAEASTARRMQQMQMGAPILLRITGGKQEELQICKLSISRDLKLLRWQEQEGDGLTREVPLSSIAEIKEAESSSDGYHALIVNLDGTQGKRSMELICASVEDFEVWRDGLRFLAVAATRSAAEQLVHKSISDSEAARSAVQDQSLRALVKKQEEMIAKLKQENATLIEVVQRKDATIAKLLRDAQARSSLAERCSKTESTSRESDDHLRYREHVMLQQKNEKLRKALKSKQKQVSELLEMLGRVMKENGAESAYEDDKELTDEDDASEADVAPTPASPSLQQGKTARVAAVQQTPQSMEDLWGTSPEGAEENPEESEALRREMLQITSQLERLEQAIQGVHGARGGSTAVPPPPVGHPITPAGEPPALPQQSFAPPSRIPATISTGASNTGPRPAPSTALDFSAMGALARAVPERKSTASLQALAKEMQLFEAKKRIVERLATSLEPGSDDDDDDDEDGADDADGFPLH